MLDLIYQSFFESFDCEKADDDDKGDDVKHIEQKIPVVLACTDGAGETDGMRQWNNLGEGANISGQI